MIVHICPTVDWEAAQAAGQYWTGVNQEEGFIHCSRPEQALAVANRYYRSQLGLLLLWIDPQALQAELRWEPVGTDHYPHLYGPLNLEAVQAVTPFQPDPDGDFRTLPLPAP